MSASLEPLNLSVLAAIALSVLSIHESHMNDIIQLICLLNCIQDARAGIGFLRKSISRHLLLFLFVFYPCSSLGGSTPSTRDLRSRMVSTTANLSAQWVSLETYLCVGPRTELSAGCLRAPKRFMVRGVRWAFSFVGPRRRDNANCAHSWQILQCPIASWLAS